VSFGTSYGVLLRNYACSAVDVFIIDREDRVRYVEYMKEITGHPNYDMVLEALNKVGAEG